MPKYQIPTLDFEAVAAMDDDARTAALDAYRAEVAALEKNPKAMRLAEARLLELLGADSAPALFATAGSASAPATVREKPKTIDEASGLARAAFGV